MMAVTTRWAKLKVVRERGCFMPAKVQIKNASRPQGRR